MPTTSEGIVYPDSSGHTRLWEHLQTIADGVTSALARRGKRGTRGILYDKSTVSTGPLTTVAGLSASAVLEVGYLYRVSFSGNLRSEQAGPIGRLRIMEGSGSIRSTGGIILSSNGVSFSAACEVLVEGDGFTHTYTVALERLTGSGGVYLDNGVTDPSFLMVECIGKV